MSYSREARGQIDDEFGSDQPRRRRRWIWLLAGCGTVIIVLCIVAVIALRIIGGNINSTRTSSWNEAARKTDIEVYAPSYVPPRAGKLTIVSPSFPGLAKTVIAQYSKSKLTISETDHGSEPNQGERADVKNTKGAWFVQTRNQRVLFVHKGNTWVSLLGGSDAQLIRIANSLRRVGA